MGEGVGGELQRLDAKLEDLLDHLRDAEDDPNYGYGFEKSLVMNQALKQIPTVKCQIEFKPTIISHKLICFGEYAFLDANKEETPLLLKVGHAGCMTNTRPKPKRDTPYLANAKVHWQELNNYAWPSRTDAAELKSLVVHTAFYEPVIPLIFDE
jgi:hypothetical protein